MNVRKLFMSLSLFVLCCTSCASYVNPPTQQEYSLYLKENKSKTTSTELDYLHNLQEVNEDVVAVLIIGDIVEPVMFDGTNTNYLTQNIFKQVSLSGSLFLDEDFSNFFDNNITVYGHNTGTDKFSELSKNYYSKNLSEDVQTIYLINEYGTHIYKLFSVYKADISVPYTLKDYSKDNMIEYNEFNELNSVTVNTGDKVLTLSTCPDTLIQDGNRLVFHYKLVM